MNRSVNEEKELQGMQRPANLRCEYTVNPVGIEVACPRFSWILVHPERGRTQSAYHILVASAREKLLNDVGDIWDSGKVKSSQSTNVDMVNQRVRTYEPACWLNRRMNNHTLERIELGRSGVSGDLHVAKAVISKPRFIDLVFRLP